MRNSILMLYVALTIDIDPDANRGHRDSIDTRTAGTDRIQVDGCREGMRVVDEVLHAESLPATLFWEARTLRILSHTNPGLIQHLSGISRIEQGCHGLRHEDLTGAHGTSSPAGERIRKIIDDATDIIHHFTGSRPRGFRAPYCRLPEKALPYLARLGYIYDASPTLVPDSSWKLKPNRFDISESSPPLWQLAMTGWSDANGHPISGYLWQMFEGKRPPTDYVQTVQDLIPRFPNGLFQIALHPWHLLKKETGHYHEDSAMHVEQFREVVASLTSLPNVEWICLKDYLKLESSP